MLTIFAEKIDLTPDAEDPPWPNIRPHRVGREHFQLMVEAVHDYGIFMLDPDGYVVSWNSGAERIKGYSEDEILGRHFSSFYTKPDLDRGWPAHELSIARKVGRFEDEGWRLRKDGSTFWANVVITALWSDEEELVGFTKVTRDLTERRRYEEALKEGREQLARANVELEQKNRDLQEFAFVAGHDLQEPLRKINTFGEMLEMEFRDKLGENGRLYVDRMRVSAQRMSELVRSLLAYSRVTTRTEPFVRVNLNQIAIDVQGDLQVLFNESGGKIEVDPLPVVVADPTQMRQLFQNLIGNALKFRRDDVPPVVVIRSSTDESIGVNTLTFADNGIGFEEKHIDLIFNPFQRLHSRGEFEGSGLGLTICRRILERHGGTITATSTLGEGTTFTVAFPMSDVDDAQ
jgi:PAS domain S-box-containing protein